MRNVLAITLLCVAIPLSANTIYLSQPSFEGALGTLLTDHYSPADGYPAGFGIYSNAVMTGYIGETTYAPTAFSNLNIVFNEKYCAGCNGSFLLDFTNTSIGSAAGVFGVGLDIASNSSDFPYWAYVTFGDDSTLNHALPAGGSFFGITDPVLIKSIHLGASGGAATAFGSFEIDSLTIGSLKIGSEEGSAVPEPSLAIPVALTLSAIGLRRRWRQSRRRN